MYSAVYQKIGEGIGQLIQGQAARSVSRLSLFFKFQFLRRKLIVNSRRRRRYVTKLNLVERRRGNSKGNSKGKSKGLASWFGEPFDERVRTICKSDFQVRRCLPWQTQQSGRKGRRVKRTIRAVVNLLICLRMTHHSKQLGHLLWTTLN